LNPARAGMCGSFPSNQDSFSTSATYRLPIALRWQRVISLGTMSRLYFSTCKRRSKEILRQQLIYLELLVPSRSITHCICAVTSTVLIRITSQSCQDFAWEHAPS
jgi:hypothetical protein